MKAHKREKLHVYYDEEGDYLEVYFGKPRGTYMHNLGKEVFARINEQSGAITGFAILGFKRRTAKCTPINIALPRAPLLHA